MVTKVTWPSMIKIRIGEKRCRQADNKGEMGNIHRRRDFLFILELVGITHINHPFAHPAIADSYITGTRKSTNVIVADKDTAALNIYLASHKTIDHTYQTCGLGQQHFENAVMSAWKQPEVVPARGNVSECFVRAGKQSCRNKYITSYKIPDQNGAWSPYVTAAEAEKL
ncbi:hypothetical protein PR048_016532 [Dryococelus australis]|uniref:Uncharacterized protein n=1 Tax=Dryococelus australis TaxID=614101 RepID=A0ABQ9HK05_9NEOP|nr:hypothetical protein PR048_016532 [Dryococelus australis]